jgi:hypothetical protein
VDRNLFVVQRQMRVEGGILDLLCVDLQGRLTVIEIKRGQLIRETIAQAIDYASSLAAMSEEALRAEVRMHLGVSTPSHPGVAALLGADATDAGEVEIVVVGVGAEPGLERMIDFLGSKFSMPIRAVSFDVFALPSGEKLLVREETEPEGPGIAERSPAATVAGVIERAGGAESAAGRKLMALKEAADRNGLYVRPHKWSLMLAPPERRNRHLITIWRWADGDGVAIQYSADAIAEFFPVTPEHVREVLGPDGDAKATPVATEAEANRWAASVDVLFKEIAERANQTAVVKTC